ncbi:MAG: sigma-54-dependent Fis family transcriptional regulator [Opitutales bacterium]|nr:sigma-54-dependent Fis family transcriptional regulator [Opitutales bacterium]
MPAQDPSALRVFLLSLEKEPTLMERLREADLRVTLLHPDDIEGISPDSLNDVYVVPFSWFEHPAWSSVRVTLARTCRYYVVLGEQLQTQHIVQATRDGAYDVVVLADTLDRIRESAENAARSQQLWWQLYGGQSSSNDQILIGQSRIMANLREAVHRAGPTVATVLIIGESGTGKERVAQALQTAYGSGPFITLNCAAIPAELMESELFGVEKGAYTGAEKPRKGLVEEASGGTLFLDEIGELSLSLQPKLLRFLETRIARRIGSNQEYKANARIIAATNRGLKAESALGKFRLDLYYRLAEVIIETPPLRDRLEDIPELSRYFIDLAAERLGKNFESLEPELIQTFQSHDWPGNVRELKQTIERLAIQYDGPVMRRGWWQPPERAKEVPEAVSESTAHAISAYPASSNPNFSYNNQAGTVTPAAPLNKKQKWGRARQLIEESGGDLTWVAAQMGIHPTTLYRWRKEGKV